MHTCHFVPASHVYSALARPLRSEFPVSERMADVPVPLRPDLKPPAGARPAPAPAHSPVLVFVGKCINKYFSPTRTVVTRQESVFTIDSNRAQPWSGVFVNHLVELPGLGKSGGPVQESIDQLKCLTQTRQL
eukprot:5438040-Pleurochrysis_carterae.AAC.1